MLQAVRFFSMLLLVGMVTAAASPVKSRNFLTDEEQNYLNHHPVIRVQNETNWPPFNYRENGHPRGFSIDYMDALARQLGVKIQYVNGHSWGEFIRMLSTPALDAMVNVSITNERQKTMAFTQPFMRAKNAIYTNVKKQAYYTLPELNGKRVALVKDFFIQKYITRHYPGIKQILVPDLEKALEMLSFEKVDAVVGKQVVVDYILRENLISSIMATDYIKEKGTVSRLAIATDKRDSLLTQILDKAQRKLDPKTIDQLKHKWFGINVLLNTRKLLTPHETEFLKNKKRLSICYQTDRLPVEAEGKVGPEGIAIDVIQTIIRRLAMNAVFVPTESEKESWHFLQQKQCDLLPGAIQGNARNEDVLFTKPYLSYTPVIVTKKGRPKVSKLKQLEKKSYAIWDNNPILQHMKKEKKHPNVLMKKNIKEALEAVQNGEAYYTVLPQSIFEYYQQRENFDDLTIAGYAPVRGDVRIAVSKSAPELLGILNKVIQVTPREAFHAISDKWIKGTVIHKTDYTAFLEVLGGALLVIGLILLSYRKRMKLTRHIEELNATLEERIETALKKNKEQEAMMLHQDRLARMGEMIAMIAHQWRQPLNNLSLTNQLLVSKYTKGKLDDKAMEYFKENSKKQITQMSETIDDFRNFYKIEKEKLDFCVSDVVHELIERTRIIFKDAGVNVTYTAEGCPMFRGYPNELKHAIQNIMSNARDALVDKQGDEKEIEIRVFEDDDAVSICIQDNAGGMPEEIQGKIFDPYFSTKDAKNGTGLGLYMANVIVTEHMNSEIILRAESDCTEFIIYLKKAST